MKAEGLTGHTGEFLLRTMNTSNLENLSVWSWSEQSRSSSRPGFKQNLTNDVFCWMKHLSLHKP